MNTENETEIPGFWDWSVAIYDVKGVPDILLTLQDKYGLDVNLILWCLWAGDHFPGRDEAALGKMFQASAEWRDKVTKRLRKIRKFLKKPPSGFEDGGDQIRRIIKDLELDSEQVEQAWLEEQTLTLPEGSSLNGAAYLEAYLHYKNTHEKKDEPLAESQLNEIRQFIVELKTLLQQIEAES